MSIFYRCCLGCRSHTPPEPRSSEDVLKMLNQVILEIDQQLAEAKKQVATAIADEKRLAKQLEASYLTGLEWAEATFQMGDVEMTAPMLRRKPEHQAYINEYQKQHQLQKAATDKLKNALRGLQNKIDEAHRKKDLLIARQKRAEAQQRLLPMLENLSETSTPQDVPQRVDPIEAKAKSTKPSEDDKAPEA